MSAKGMHAGHVPAARVAPCPSRKAPVRRRDFGRVRFPSDVQEPRRLLRGLDRCLVTTLEPGGVRRTTVARFAVDAGRLLVRAPVTSDLASRVWRSSRVTVAPCNPRGRILGPPIEVVARVIADAEERAAEAVLAAGDGPVERLRHWLDRRRGVELLYVEIAPT
jgi:hypothetical protein